MIDFYLRLKNRENFLCFYYVLDLKNTDNTRGKRKKKRGFEQWFGVERCNRDPFRAEHSETNMLHGNNNNNNVPILLFFFFYVREDNGHDSRLRL